MNEEVVAVLIERARAGDEKAWGELVGSFLEKLHRRANRFRRAGFPHRSTSDLVGDTVEKVLKARGSFNGWGDTTNTLTQIWCMLATTMKRHALNLIRQDETLKRTPPGRRVSAHGPDTSDAATPTPAAPAPAVPHGTRRDVAEALKRLSPEDHKLLDDYFFNDLSVAELARTYNCCRKTMTTRVERAKARLGAILRERE